MTADRDLDPLTLAIAPPPNETPAERAAREKSEQEALQRSRCIDAELKLAKAAMKRYKKAIKVLVLGQSLSGKSTTIKNFQIAYAQKSWCEERESWRAVILLNLVRSVNIITDVLNDAGNREIRNSVDNQAQAAEGVIPTERHRSVVLRLVPLRQIEKDLKTFLGAGSSEVDFTPRFIQEFCVRSSSGWKSILDQIRNPEPGKESQLHRVACHVVSGCKEDIRWLWNDTVTKKILHARQLRLEDSPGFFLDDVERIAGLEYQPSDQDIVRARLRTTGVQEHHFTMDRANAGGVLDWVMYDVAGKRHYTYFAAWIPYFREITALIFLAPISSFNERLEEDPRIYRLEDTFNLWKTICSSRLLDQVQIILFLNKTDLLQKKLEQGIRLQKYIPEYDKANDYETVSTWFRKIFKRYYLQHSAPGRIFISHFTSVVDTKATALTLQAVQATILRNDIAGAGLM
ncbi:hypothetical protein GALMADRAFT_69553 [Galerina marginata CBS 339.88]|uniref:G-alpha-domain-containing protein n=1 Tax=Galerina marginata (strain CBS 339.88) TaxID=685588 RepID=A0A067SWI3_GALM3|nr:hypothetical protein GALMADRAFT_69553 [Galerina marginata CBS 339.88]